MILTALVLILFVVGVFSLTGNEEKLTIFCIIMGMTTIAGIYYCPKSIEANDSGITLHRLLSSPKVFHYNSIQTVDTFYPSVGGLRLCASGGYFRLLGLFQRLYDRHIHWILWQPK